MRSAIRLLGLGAALMVAACGDDASVPAGLDAPPCPPGQTLCGDSCATLETDLANCGACGVACDAGEVCNGAGACELSCQAGLLNCGGVCTDPNTDRNHCGATDACDGATAGDVCDAGEICNGAGACELSCQAGLVNCGGLCIDPSTDRNHCGATDTCEGASAGDVCDAGEICSGAGACEVACQAGLVNCGGLCIDPSTDRNHCGAADTCEGASAGDVCDAGEICNGAGACELSCQAGLVNCGGLCIDPSTDRNHCGATDACDGATAGDVCDAGEVCNGAGVCELSCQAGLLNCGGVCTDPSTDRNHCGATDACDGATAGDVCDAGEVCNGAGVCELSCQAGLLNCGGVCTDPNTDRNHCGATDTCDGATAGDVCDAGEICNGAGVCEVSCQAGLLTCGDTCINPETDQTFCGASGDCTGGNAGETCDSSSACFHGTCVNVCQVETFTFSFTGAEQTFVVPPGVVALAITALGAQGGDGVGNFQPGVGGLGGRAIGDLTVSTGDVITLNVGGRNGFNGGGAPGPGSGAGGNGGGASDVRVGGTALANRVLVAGGGGGAAAGPQGSCQQGPGGSGGVGGGFVGTSGTTGAGCGAGGVGGEAGTAAAGGAGGAGNVNCSATSGAGGAGTAGTGGNGGDGIIGCGGFTGSGGGGGGGGYFGGGGAGGGAGGGGGAWSGGGGGGGSSYVGTLANASTDNAINSGDGSITITTVCP